MPLICVLFFAFTYQFVFGNSFSIQERSAFRVSLVVVVGDECCDKDLLMAYCLFNCLYSEPY